MSTHLNYEINKELGECYLFMGEYEQAKQYYEKALNEDTKQIEPYLGLAAIALTTGELESALDLYKKADALQSNDKTLAGIAMIECEQGAHESAYANFCAALEVNPINMVAINGLVQLGYYLNRLEQIIPYLVTAVEAQEDEAVRYALSACLLSIGRDDEAREHLEVLLGVNPSNTEALKLYAHFAA